jgi:hypothetical protein
MSFSNTALIQAEKDVFALWLDRDRRLPLTLTFDGADLTAAPRSRFTINHQLAKDGLNAKARTWTNAQVREILAYFAPRYAAQLELRKSSKSADVAAIDEKISLLGNIE